MSRTSWILTAAGGAAAVTAATAWVTGRSRPDDTSLGVAKPPSGLPPSRTVSLDGHGEIFFRDQPGPADKPPIVLLHGWVVSADLNWFTTYGPLEEVGRVIAPDHRGHGRGARHSMPFRLADVADDIAALLRAEGTGPAIIVGYSMGGPLTQLLWQRHPDVVAGIVLCATAAHFNFSTVTALGWRFITLYQLGQRLLPRTWIERVLLTQAQDAVGPNLLRRAAPGITELSPLLPWVVGELQRGEIEDLAEAGRELSRFDSRGWITGIDVPGRRHHPRPPGPTERTAAADRPAERPAGGRGRGRPRRLGRHGHGVQLRPAQGHRPHRQHQPAPRRRRVTDRPAPEVPVSRQLGRATGRWWNRHGDTVKQVSRPARKGWATLAGYLWFVAYMWVGLMIAVGVRNITGTNGPFVMVAAVGGGAVLGWWQAQHRMARHVDPDTPPMNRFGLALCAWLGVVGLALLLDLR